MPVTILYLLSGTMAILQGPRRTFTYNSWYMYRSIFLDSRYLARRRRRMRMRRIQRILVGRRASRVPLRLPGACRSRQHQFSETGGD